MPTDRETEALNREYNDLAARVEVQCAEQNDFLRREIRNDPKLTDLDVDRLHQILDRGGFKVRLFQVNDSNASKKLQVQVTYDVDDDLWAYLNQDAALLPLRLRGFLAGGAVLAESKPIAEDLVPLTGKTRTGVLEYDRILELRKK